MIHTGLPRQHNGGVTTGLTMTFNAVSDVEAAYHTAKLGARYTIVE